MKKRTKLCTNTRNYEDAHRVTKKHAQSISSITIIRRLPMFRLIRQFFA